MSSDTGLVYPGRGLGHRGPGATPYNHPMGELPERVLGHDVQLSNNGVDGAGEIGNKPPTIGICFWNNTKQTELN